MLFDPIIHISSDLGGLSSLLRRRIPGVLIIAGFLLGSRHATDQKDSRLKQLREGDLLARRERMILHIRMALQEPLVRLVLQERREQRGQKARPVRPARQAQQEQRERQGQKARPARPVRQAQQEQRGQKARPVPPAPLVRLTGWPLMALSTAPIRRP